MTKQQALTGCDEGFGVVICLSQCRSEDLVLAQRSTIRTACLASFSEIRTDSRFGVLLDADRGFMQVQSIRGMFRQVQQFYRLFRNPVRGHDDPPWFLDSILFFSLSLISRRERPGFRLLRTRPARRRRCQAPFTTLPGVRRIFGICFTDRHSAAKIQDVSRPEFGGL